MEFMHSLFGEANFLPSLPESFGWMCTFGKKKVDQWIRRPSSFDDRSKFYSVSYDLYEGAYLLGVLLSDTRASTEKMISCFLLAHTLCRADTEISLYRVWNVYDPLTRRTELEDAEVEIQALDLEIVVL